MTGVLHTARISTVEIILSCDSKWRWSILSLVTKCERWIDQHDTSEHNLTPIWVLLVSCWSIHLSHFITKLNPYALFQNGCDPGWSGSSCTKMRHRGPWNTTLPMMYFWHNLVSGPSFFNGGRHSWQFIQWKKYKSTKEFWVKVLVKVSWRFLQRIVHKNATL